MHDVTSAGAEPCDRSCSRPLISFHFDPCNSSIVQTLSDHDRHDTNTMESSPLNKLAPELRNNIWEFALTEPYGIRLDVSTRKAKACRTGRVERNGSKPFSPPRPSVALQATCKQIRRETQQLYFSVNNLVVETSSERYVQKTGWPSSLRKWACDVGAPCTQSLRSVNIEIGSMTLCDKITLYFDFESISYIRNLFHVNAEVTMTLRIEVRPGMMERLTVPIGSVVKAMEKLEQLCANIALALANRSLFEPRAAQIKTWAVMLLKEELKLLFDRISTELLLGGSGVRALDIID